MCEFKSAIVLRDEQSKGGFRLLLSPWTEHHSELEIIYKLRDPKTATARLNYAKVEFVPADMAFAYKPETYKLRIDEDRTPEWLDSEMQEKVADKMCNYIKSIIVSGDVQLLIGGQFIIAPGAKIESANCMVISAMCGGTLSDMRGGTLSDMRGGTLSDMWGGTLSAMCGGTLSDMWGGTLSAMWGGTLSDMRGGTLQKIEEVYTLLIGKIHPEATIIKDLRKK